MSKNRNKEAIDVLLNEREYVLAMIDNALTELCRHVKDDKVENFSDVMCMMDGITQNYVCRYVSNRLFDEEFIHKTFDSIMYQVVFQELLNNDAPYKRWKMNRELANKNKGGKVKRKKI